MTNLYQPVFGPAEIDRERIHVLDWTNYETQVMNESKPMGVRLDMVLLGVGSDGHFLWEFTEHDKIWRFKVSRVNANATPEMY